MFEEVAALVSVHPDALHECVIRHEGGHVSAVVSGGRLCASGSDGEVKEDRGALIDVAALEECLGATVGGVAPADAHASETSWVPDWVSELGVGISVLCMISPEEATVEGLPVLAVHSPPDEHSEPNDLLHVLVQYLPPIKVAVHCTTAYPDQEPALEVYAPWLEKEAIEHVVLTMKAAAADQGEGLPVLLTWLECVKTETAQSLTAVTIRPGCGSSMVRSLPGSHPTFVRFSSLWLCW